MDNAKHPRDGGRNAQLVRTLQILRELDRAGGLSLEQLAERFGITLRTVRRDLDALQEAGFALSSEQADKQKRWKLDPTSHARRLSALLDKGHFLAVRAAIGHAGSSSLFRALEDLADKIERAIGVHGQKQLAAIDRCFYSYEKHAYNRAAPDILWPLVAAIEQRRVCRVTYCRPQREPLDKQFEILPLRIFAHQGATYLMCHVLKHESFGTLNLQRLRRLEVLEREAQVPLDFAPERLEAAAFGVHTGAALTRYVLRFEADVAAYIRERTWHPSQSLTELLDGTVELSFTCGQSWEVSAWVASWRHWVQVVEPRELRTELCELGALLVKQYAEARTLSQAGGDP